jgi:hypothetical protein
MSTDQANTNATNFKAPSSPCFSCQVWSGAAHLGIAAYLGSISKRQNSRISQAFILTFAAGNYFIFLL